MVFVLLLMVTDDCRADEPRVVPANFDAFYSRAWDGVYRAVVVAVGETDLAREAVDEAMSRAFERWSSVSVMANPEGWVYRVAVNWSRSILRRRRLGATRYQRVTRPIDEIEVPDPRVLEEVQKLPPHQRDVIVARFLLDMSTSETAEAFGVAEGTIKSRVSRALSALKEGLS